MVTPRCPFCNTAGLNNVEAVPFGPALLVFCKSCGAIHGVVANPKSTPVGAAGSTAAGSERPQSAPVGAADHAGQRLIAPGGGPKPAPAKLPQGEMTPERAAAMSPFFAQGTNYRIIRPLTDEEANGE